MSQQSDPALHESAAGDAPQAACCEWYQAYGERLYNYLRFHLSSPDQAEDLTAEVFLRAISRFHQFDPSLGSPRAWLFRIAQNVLRDHFRRTRRHQLLPVASFRDLQSDAPSPEERLLRQEEVARLLFAVGKLPERDREIIGLCYGSELSVSEAGEILGLSNTAIRTRMWRALARLRRALSP